MKRTIFSKFCTKHSHSSSILACRNLSTVNSPKICIVGSGPAGFYAAQHIIKNLPEARVDILERLPIPFGLVRYGVAPDHPEVKNVINTFTKTAQSDKVRFVGNVDVGQDVSVSELQDAYNAVLLAYGADADRELGVPGETLDNCVSARRVVGWYNGAPADSSLALDLDHETVAVIGQGNVALDVARILLTPVDALRNTDITDYALDALSKSRVERVVLVGRRGPLHVAFTIKELREMVNLPQCSTVMSSADFTAIPEIIPTLPRSRKRLIELLCKTALDPRQSPGANKVFQPVFLRTPLEILHTAKKVTGIQLCVNRLEGDRAVPDRERQETLNCGLVLRSVGYRSVPACPDVPFDTSAGLVPNRDGLVSPGLYVAGWLGTGPVGVLLSTMSNAFAVAGAMVRDLATSVPSKPGISRLQDLLFERGVERTDWTGWEAIDAREVERGREAGKPREKIVDVDEMLRVARAGR